LLKIWPSAKLLVAYMASHGGLKGTSRRVLELGCGVGLAGIAAAALGGRVVLTDRDANGLDRTKGNIELNSKAIAASGGASHRR
jgi:predicted nicotinamide N-methyase